MHYYARHCDVRLGGVVHCMSTLYMCCHVLIMKVQHDHVCSAKCVQVQPKFHGVPIVVFLLAALLLLQGWLLGRH